MRFSSLESLLRINFGEIQLACQNSHIDVFEIVGPLDDGLFYVSLGIISKKQWAVETG
jgi:hypothetical protein